MRHLIILNGRAGEGTAINHVNDIEKAFKGLDAEIHYTSAPDEATSFLRAYLSEHKDPIRVYACGGDGTLNECLNGIIGFDNVELAVYSIGTGNDFVKIYGGTEKFLNLDNIINGTTEEIDISKIVVDNEKEVYSLNAINMGFDAYVGAIGNTYKEKHKKNPYDKALVTAIFSKRFNKFDVVVDGVKISKKKTLLCNFCHGQYIGGKFHTAPRSDNKDGLLEVLLAPAMSLFSFLSILDSFTNGKHLDNPKTAKRFIYLRGKEVTIDSKKRVPLCFDGEIIYGKHFEITTLPKAIKFILPKE